MNMLFQKNIVKKYLGLLSKEQSQEVSVINSNFAAKERIAYD